METFIGRALVAASAAVLGGTVLAAEPSGSGVPVLPRILFYIAFLLSLTGLCFAFKFYREMMRAPEGTDRMKEIAQYVREGAYAYLYAQYKTVSLVFLLLFGVFLALAHAGIQNPFVPVAFLTGGFFPGCAVFSA